MCVDAVRIHAEIWLLAYGPTSRQRRGRQSAEGDRVEVASIHAEKLSLGWNERKRNPPPRSRVRTNGGAVERWSGGADEGQQQSKNACQSLVRTLASATAATHHAHQLLRSV